MNTERSGVFIEMPVPDVTHPDACRQVCNPSSGCFKCSKKTDTLTQREARFTPKAVGEWGALDNAHVAEEDEHYCHGGYEAQAEHHEPLDAGAQGAMVGELVGDYFLVEEPAYINGGE